MRLFVPGPLFVLLVACATSPESASQIVGVTRVSIPSGCYAHVSERDWNVRLSDELEASLVGLLKEVPSGARCWYEKRDGRILAAFADECGPHREALFEHVAGRWMLVRTEDVSVVLCDARRP